MTINPLDYPALDKNIKVVAMVLSHNTGHMLKQAKERIPFDFFSKVYVIENGSPDGSSDIAKKLGFNVIDYKKVDGYGRAVKRGLVQAFEKEGADYVVEIHGDGAEFDPMSVYPAIEHMNKKVDHIIGSRFQDKKMALKKGMPYDRFFANIILSYIDKKIFNLKFTEFHTGFRIYSKNLYNTIPWIENADTYNFSFEIFAQTSVFKLSYAEVKVTADYIGLHTSSSYYNSIIYVMENFKTKFQFILAKYFKVKFKIFIRKELDKKKALNL